MAPTAPHDALTRVARPKSPVAETTGGLTDGVPGRVEALTDAVPDAAPSPCAFTAVTANVYDWPPVSPPTVVEVPPTSMRRPSETCTT